MWEKIKDIYEAVVGKIVEVENILSGKTGEQKKDAVIDYIINLYNIPWLPDFIETPAKRFAIGLIVDLLVEKLNIVCDWDFKNANITSDTAVNVAKIANMPAAKVMDIVSAMPSTADINDKFAVLARQYIKDGFDESIAFSLKWEGGKNYTGSANGDYTLLNKADKGGPTNMGITLPTLAHAVSQGVISNDNLDTLTLDDVKAIYRANYWDNRGFGDIIMPAALCCLDCAINHGGFAWILQRAIVDTGYDLVVDGKYGPKTRERLVESSNNSGINLAQAIVNQRKVYYDNIVAKDEGQRANLKGWYNRLKAMAEAAGVVSPV